MPRKRRSFLTIPLVLGVGIGLTVAACDEGTPQAPEGASPVGLVLRVVPSQIDLTVGDTVRFVAQILGADGNPLTVPVRWRANGGTIDGAGIFVAGESAGSFQVLAQSTVGTTGLGSSAGGWITLASGEDSTAAPPPGPPAPPAPPGPWPTSPAQSIVIAPDRAAVAIGESLQFTATLLDAGARPVAGQILWQATGGSVDGTGRYVATGPAGDHSVVARSGELHVRAAITVYPLGGAPPEPPPMPPPTVPGNAIEVRPGQSIQAAVDAAPAGATFLLKVGVHRRQSVRPKPNQTFVGEAGAVMDGEGTTKYAFDGQPSARGVTIRGLEIRNYEGEKYMGALKIGYFWDWPSQSASDWTVESCEIHDNEHSGISTGPGAVIRNNHVHHNGQTGITGYWDDVVIEGNEVNHNNAARKFSTGDEAGGMKIKQTDRLVVRNNHVHDNWGKGIWLDISNIHAVVEGNRVENNSDAGIMHEIGYQAVIRNNTVRGNGHASYKAGVHGWNWNAGIVIPNSSDVEVYGNTVENNRGGITAFDQNRGSGSHGPWIVKNLWVHDNTVRFSVGSHGLDTETGQSAIFTSRNNRFDRNDYRLPGPLGQPFRWRGNRTWLEWRAAGLDLAGALLTG